MSNFINPHRGSGDLWLLYTTEEGTECKMVGANMEMYLETIKKGYFELKTGDRPAEKIYPAYMMLTTVIDGYDFVLADINRKNKRQ